MMFGVCLQFPLFAQEKRVAAAGTAGVTVPFVGCKSDGQAGPREAPEGEPVSVPISREAAEGLAYYSSDAASGVLAPRLWSCLGVYGSGGDALLVSPDPIGAKNLFSKNWHGFSGPAVVLSHRLGDSMGRFDVAEVIARVFPAYMPFVAQVAELFSQPAATFPLGPYPGDVVTYQSSRMVEFRTRANREGLGTRSWLTKSAHPIDGVAMLVGETPDLLILSVRLPTGSAKLVPVIVKRFEEETRTAP
ncbi:MAG: hypothetical protein IPP47_20035 [Bryobacterales bacterium]|nr:hypothetical protein [Bryobacterales bacterium]